MLEEDQYLIDIITQSPLVYKDTSLIKNAGYGLFANKLIEKNTVATRKIQMYHYQAFARIKM